MKMAELEKRTGVNRETIRVYIRSGLLPEPERPKPTVAHYNEDHVQAILTIRQLQQQYRMTLAQIGNVLQGRPVDHRVEATAFTHLEQLVASRFPDQDQLVALDTLTEANPAAITDAKAFQSLGIVDRITTPTGAMVSHTDARLLAIWGEMRAAGFDEGNNFYADSLDHYFRAAEYLAHAEAEKFLARTEGRLSEEKAAEMLRFALPLMLDFFGLLRTKFFIRNIAREAGRRDAHVHTRLTPVLPPTSKDGVPSTD